MNWLQKISSIRLMYHGTSATKLRSILSEGLNTQHEAVWDTGKGQRDHSRSLESYGGTYFSSNFMSAVSAAGTANEKFEGSYRDTRGIVIAQLELRTPSILIDEDSLPHPISAVNDAFNMISNDFWLTYWADAGYPDIDKAVVSYFRLLGVGTHDLTPHIAEYIKATVARQCAQVCEQSREKNDWDRYHEKFPDLDIGRAQAESDMISAANVLMQKIQDKSNKDTGFMHNVRILEPVSFRGKNKIVLIAEMHSESDVSSRLAGSYYVDFVLLYNKSQQAVDMLIKDAVKSQSQNIRVRDKNDNIFYDNPKKEKNELVATS